MRNRLRVVAALTQEQAEEMQGIGVIGGADQCQPIQSLGLLQVAGAMRQLRLLKLGLRENLGGNGHGAV